MSGALDRLLLGARGGPPGLLPMPLTHQIAGAPPAEGFDESSATAPARETRPSPPQNARPISAPVREAQSTPPQGRRADLRRDLPSADDVFADAIREMRGAPPERSYESAAMGFPTDEGAPDEGGPHEGAAEGRRSSERAPAMHPAMPERAAAIEVIPPADATSSAPRDPGFPADEAFVERHHLPEPASATLPSVAGRAAAAQPSFQAPRLSPEIAAARESVATTMPAPPDRVAPRSEPGARDALRPNAPPRSTAQGDPAMRQGSQTQSSTAVQVTIGRVEVKAAPAAQPARPRPAAPQLPKLSLADYLKRRGSRSP